MKPIRSQEDHRAILDEIERLMSSAPGTAQADRLEVLAVLASEYERRAVLKEQGPDPVEVLGIIMRGKRLTQAALAEVIGSRARASEVLSRRRKLSSEMIDRVSQAWSVPRHLLTGASRTAAGPNPLRKVTTAAMVALSILGAGLASPFIVYGQDLPDIAPLVAMADGDVRGLPPHVPQAFIAMQDQDFLTHSGYDSSAIIRATGQTLAHLEGPKGGATLTQQLLKNTLLKDEPRSMRRKVREFILARRLEQRLTKDQILQLYLTQTYFGGGTIGIEAAANRYFQRPAGALSVAQAAYLASLVNAPDDLRFDKQANRGRAIIARDRALRRMVRAGYLTPAIEQSAARERFW
jgi:penicillin-binding protein 1A